MKPVIVNAAKQTESLPEPLPHRAISDYPSNPKPGDLVVWNSINPPSRMDRYAVKTVDEAKSLIRRLIDAQLDDPTVEANAFGLEAFDGQEWSEWDDPETGDDVMSVMDAEDEEEQETT